VFKFCWIVDFPMFEYDEDAKKVDFSHNPFSMPQGELEALETMDPLDILAYQYDIVCNGVELSSGAIRNHRPEIMYKAFEIAGYSQQDVDTNFAGMINAFKYGAPPHGGSAPGVDRIVMLLADEPNIREVIVFPMTQKAEDLMMGAPLLRDAQAVARTAHPHDRYGRQAGRLSRPAQKNQSSCRRKLADLLRPPAPVPSTRRASPAGAGDLTFDIRNEV
jgi:aspartyl-tRNA synthetase